MSFWKMFPAAMVLMGVLDFVWLGLLMKDFVKGQLTGLARIEAGAFVPVWWSAGLVYVVMALAITLFGMARVDENASWLSAAAWCGLLGFCIYGTYDFTNHATLLRWPLPFMALDLFWGTAQFAITAALLQTFRKYLS